MNSSKKDDTVTLLLKKKCRRNETLFSTKFTVI